MDEVKTGVDELMELVRRERRISVPDAAKILKQHDGVVQNWVDFLVEEKLLGIEYKFTTPYIYLNNPEVVSSIKQKTPSITEERKEFVERARAKNMPEPMLAKLWQNHLLETLENKKEFFTQECAKRGLTPEPLLKRYREHLLEEYELRTSA